MYTLAQIFSQLEQHTLSAALSEFLIHNELSGNKSAPAQLAEWLEAQQEKTDKRFFHKHDTAILKGLKLYAEHLAQQPIKISGGLGKAQNWIRILAFLFREKTSPQVLALLIHPGFSSLVSQPQFFAQFYHLASTYDSAQDKDLAALLQHKKLTVSPKEFLKNYDILLRAHQKDHSQTLQFVAQVSAQEYKKSSPGFEHLPFVVSLLLSYREVVFSDKMNNNILLTQILLDNKVSLALHIEQYTAFLEQNLGVQKILKSALKKYKDKMLEPQRIYPLLQSEALYTHVLSDSAQPEQTQQLLLDFAHSGERAENLRYGAVSPQGFLFEFFSLLIQPVQKGTQFLLSAEKNKAQMCSLLKVIAQTPLDIASLVFATNVLLGLQPQTTAYKKSTPVYTTSTGKRKKDPSLFVSLISPFQEKIHTQFDKAVEYYLSSLVVFFSFEQKGRSYARSSEEETVFALSMLAHFYKQIEQLQLENEKSAHPQPHKISKIQEKYGHIFLNLVESLLTAQEIRNFTRANTEARKEIYTHIQTVQQLLDSPLTTPDIRAALFSRLFTHFARGQGGDASFYSANGTPNGYALLMSTVDNQTNSKRFEEIKAQANLWNSLGHSKEQQAALQAIEQGFFTQIEKFKLERLIDTVPQRDIVAPESVSKKAHKI